MPAPISWNTNQIVNKYQQVFINNPQVKHDPGLTNVIQTVHRKTEMLGQPIQQYETTDSLFS